PFTTVAQRLIFTTRSFRLRPSASTKGMVSFFMSLLAPLELQSGFACRVRERLDAAVVAVAGAVERDRLDSRGLRALRDLRADGLRAGDGAALGVAEGALLGEIERGRGAERHALVVVHDLRV